MPRPVRNARRRIWPGLALAGALGLGIVPAGAGRAGEVPAQPAAGGAPEDPAEAEQQRRRIQQLSVQLSDADLGKVRQAAKDLLATRSPLAAEGLWRLYAEGDGQRRELALKTLRELKPEQAEERMLDAAMNDPLLALRRLGAEALAQWLGREKACARFGEVVEDAKRFQPLYRYRAVQLVAHVGGKDAGARLLKYLEDKDPSIAAAAAEGLGNLGDLKLVPELVKRLRGSEKEVAAALAESLEQLTEAGNRFNLVAWEQWLVEYQAGRIALKKGTRGPEEESTGEQEGAGPAGRKAAEYQPDYRDPYAAPLARAGVDFVLVYDTTGSFARKWLRVFSRLDAVIREMARQTGSFRMGAVRYRADDPHRSLNYLVKALPFTRDIEAAREYLKSSTFGGGSSGWHLGLRTAITQFEWRTNARKFILVVGDTPPDRGKGQLSYQMVREGWAYDRIQCNTFLAPSEYHPGDHEPEYSRLALYGSGRFYLWLRDWEHIQDKTPLLLDPQVKLDKKTAEQPTETFKKWLTPVQYPPELLHPGTE